MALAQTRSCFESRAWAVLSSAGLWSRHCAAPDGLLGTSYRDQCNHWVYVMTFDASWAWHWLYWAAAIGYCVAAIVGSVLYGWKACEIFDVSTKKKDSEELQPRSWRIHQFWLNFLGSLVGWVAAWALLRPLVACATGPCALSVSTSTVLLFFLAFIGVTGHLPWAVVGAIAGSVGGIIEIINKLAALKPTSRG